MSCAAVLLVRLAPPLPVLHPGKRGGYKFTTTTTTTPNGRERERDGTTHWYCEPRTNQSPRTPRSTRVVAHLVMLGVYGFVSDTTAGRGLCHVRNASVDCSVHARRGEGQAPRAHSERVERVKTRARPGKYFMPAPHFEAYATRPSSSRASVDRKRRRTPNEIFAAWV